MTLPRVLGVVLVLIGVCAPILRAQAVPIINPSFEDGTGTPEGWALAGCDGAWLTSGGGEGLRAVSVVGDGANDGGWFSDPLPLRPDALYRVRFRARSLGGRGGTPVSGPVFCNRDLGDLPERWQEYESVFFSPHQVAPESARLRFGQWQVRGGVAFDDVELVPLEPAWTRCADVDLGDGETIHGNQYRFRAPYEGAARNHARPLVQYSGRFNTNRWVMGPGDVVEYRHQIGARLQQDGEFSLGICAYQSGELVVEVAADDGAWRTLATLSADGRSVVRLPARHPPCRELRVRLHARPRAGDAGCALQINHYAYGCTVDGAPMEGRGATHHAVTRNRRPDLDVRLIAVETEPSRTRGRLRFAVENPADTAHVQQVVWYSVPRTAGARPLQGGTRMSFVRGHNVLDIPWAVGDPGEHEVFVMIGDAPFWMGQVRLTVPALFESRSGELLAGAPADAPLWWTAAGRRVAQERPLPTRKSRTMLLRAAAGEAESVQLVVTPTRTVRGVTITPSLLTGPGGAIIPAERIDVRQVHYLPVTEPTDSVGVEAAWPDPLLPLTAPVDLVADRNQPFWIRVHVPRGTPAGRYRGLVNLNGDHFTAQAGLDVEVYGFELPERMSCSTAFGFDAGLVARYHHLTDPAQQRAVLARYWDSFATHHISPYDAAPLDPFRVDWQPGGLPGAPQARKPVFDWQAWDAAMTDALEHRHFTTLSVPFPGLGGGSYHDRVEPALHGFGPDSVEYEAMMAAYGREIEDHLRARGWLDRGFVYWFDEPEPRDYPFVMAGFERLKRFAPGLRRMLTEQPEPGLIGGPNLWCPITSAFDPAAAEARRAAGETLWWYVCTGPKAPYATLFLDHPATDLRVWLWQTWQRGIAGVLIWQTNYWTSDAAYPDPAAPQNPYLDPMSWTSGYGTAPGTRLAWGNGDGRLLYPPLAAADGLAQAPVLDGPVESLRWEMLRDGIEDYEYHALLQRLLAEKGAGLTQQEKLTLRALLTVPEEISRSLTEFTTDPAVLDARRDQLARAIEKLSRAK